MNQPTSYSESVGVRSERGFCENNGPSSRGIAFFRGGVPLHTTAFTFKTLLRHYTPPLKKAIPQLQGPLFSQKPRSERTPTDSEYDVG